MNYKHNLFFTDYILIVNSFQYLTLDTPRKKDVNCVGYCMHFEKDFNPYRLAHDE